MPVAARQSHRVERGDSVEIRKDGPRIACYRIDKLLFVPPGADVVGGIEMGRISGTRHTCTHRADNAVPPGVP